VTLVWAVPVVAAALAMVWLLTRARAVEEAVTDLAGEARELHRLRAALAEIRRATADTGALVHDFREAHATNGEGAPDDSR
jgi:hypothetical protein